jgi:acetyl esterase/lipase
MDRRSFLAFGTLALTGAQASAANGKAAPKPSTEKLEIIDLWPGTPPGGEDLKLTEQVLELSPGVRRDRAILGVLKPTLTVMRPKKPDGSAIVIAPGGGYVRQVYDKEGLEIGQRLNAAGVTAFVLTYRLPGEGWKDAANVPLQDAQRALRLVRSKAVQFAIDPARVGIMGFSAGGHLAASLATRWSEYTYPPVDAADTLDPKPDFAVLMYPVITMRVATQSRSRNILLGAHPTEEQIEFYSCEKRVTTGTPPAFICLAGDDESVPPVSNGIAMASAMHAARVPNELHVFAEGRHGFALRLEKEIPATAWPELLLHWAKRGGWVRG